MNRFLIYLALSLAAGIALGAWLTRDPTVQAPVAVDRAGETGPFDRSAGVEDRIEALERAVNTEREARRVLEDELLALYAEIENLEHAETGADDGEAPTAEAATPARPAREDPSARERRREESKRAALLEAGFSPERTDYILERESALQFERMQAIYEARNSDAPRERFEAIQSPDQALRAELGDGDYERYLEATGQPTSVGVRSILASSPAESAGLQPGDQIVGYNGERIFGANELMMRAMQAGADETVTVDILRDGVPMQVMLPRGPLGIEIARGRGRGR